MLASDRGFRRDGDDLECYQRATKQHCKCLGDGPGSARTSGKRKAKVERDDFYKKVRRQVHEWAEGKGQAHEYAEYILLAPDLAHLLIRLTLDNRVDTKSKAKLGAALAYFVSPIDLIPEALLGPVGYVDDVAVACLALNAILNEEHNREVADEHWQGDQDLLTEIQRVLAVANEMLGSKVWNRIRGRFGSR
jgi:uncharacterized membrane protein YkvA (DUF1232 family)